MTRGNRLRKITANEWREAIKGGADPIREEEIVQWVLRVLAEDSVCVGPEDVPAVRLVVQATLGVLIGMGLIPEEWVEVQG